MHVYLVRSDDWEALYIDGLRRIEGHEVRINDAFRAVNGYQIESFEDVWLEGGLPEDWSNFPPLLEELKAAIPVDPS